MATEAEKLARIAAVKAACWLVTGAATRALREFLGTGVNPEALHILARVENRLADELISYELWGKSVLD